MRPVHLVLAASLIANLVLVLAWWRHAPAADEPSKEIAARAGSADGPVADASRDGKTLASENPGVGLHARAIASFQAGDPLALRDGLRALGWTEEKVTAVVRALVWTRYYDRRRELVAKHRESHRSWQDDRYVRFTAEERAELRNLASGASDEAFKLLGPAGLDATGTRAGQYSYLPPVKAARLHEIETDYAEMRSQLTEESREFRVPSDAEKLTYLEQQRLKDIEAALSSEEFADYERHHSSTATVLRNRVANLDVTEAELKALYEAQRKAENFPLSIPRGSVPPGVRVALTPEQAQQSLVRRNAQQEANAEIRAVLGEERWAHYQRGVEVDYRQLQAAARRFNLDAVTVEKVYALRADTAAASEQIGADQTLTTEKKVEALAALAERTRGQVRAALGEEIGNAYLNVAMQWLNQVKSGNIVAFGENGSMRMRSVVPGARPGPPTPR